MVDGSSNTSLIAPLVHFMIIVTTNIFPITTEGRLFKNKLLLVSRLPIFSYVSKFNSKMSNKILDLKNFFRKLSDVEDVLEEVICYNLESHNSVTKNNPLKSV